MKKPKYLLRSELDEDMILALKNKDLKAVKLIREINSETELLLDDEEAYQIYVTLKACNKLEGEVAELGVYKGASAKLMCEATNKKVHLFDTFKGLPKPQEVDKKEGFQEFEEQEFTASRKEVEKYLSKYKNWIIHEGMFPETARVVENKTFCFVHLDLDLYKSTKSALEFFWPRMVKGGCIIVHDYIQAIGVREAVDEFFEDKNAVPIELYLRQCLIVK